MAESKSKEDLFELFECSICMESIVDRQPRTLKCLHTFCLCCLDKMAVNRKVTCPKCRLDTYLPAGGATALPRNTDLCKMRDREMALKTKMHHLCETCLQKDCDTPATNMCIQCARKMCQSCVAYHDQFTVFRSHQVLPLPGSDKTIDTCFKHGASIEYLCRECNERLCTDCMFDRKHENHMHRVQVYELGIKNLRTTLESLKCKVQSYLQGTTECHKGLQKDCDFICRTLKSLCIIQQDLRSKLEQIDEICEIIEDVLKPVCLAGEKVRERKEQMENTLRLLEQAEVSEDYDLVDRFEDLQYDTHATLCSTEKVFAYRMPKYIGLRHDDYEAVAQGLIGKLYTHCKARRIVPTIKPKLHLSLSPGNGVEIRSPWALQPSGDGTVLVLDSDLTYLQQLDLRGKVSNVYGRPQQEDEDNPKCIMLLCDHYLFKVIDSCVIRTSILDPTDGVGLRSATLLDGSKIIGLLVPDPQTAFVLDTAGGRVTHFDFENKTAQVVLEDLDQPTYVSHGETPKGRRYAVTEAGHTNRVTLYNADWVPVAKTTGYLFTHPCACAITPEGTLMVADSELHTVVDFTLSGFYLQNILTERDGIRHPVGLAYDFPYLWVAETDQCTGSSKIKLFHLLQHEGNEEYASAQGQDSIDADDNEQTT